MKKQNIFNTTETQIGDTLYIVKTYPSETAAVTAEELLARLVSSRFSKEEKSKKTPGLRGK